MVSELLIGGFRECGIDECIEYVSFEFKGMKELGVWKGAFEMLCKGKILSKNLTSLVIWIVLMMILRTMKAFWHVKPMFLIGLVEDL